MSNPKNQYDGPNMTEKFMFLQVGYFMFKFFKYFKKAFHGY